MSSLKEPVNSANTSLNDVMMVRLTILIFDPGFS